MRSLRNLNNNGYYRLQKWAAIALARYLAPARGLDPWRRPKGSWALGTRMPRRSISALTRGGACASHGNPDVCNDLVELAKRESARARHLHFVGVLKRKTDLSYSTQGSLKV